MYEKDIDMQKLKPHLQLLPDVIKLIPLDGIPIREVTRVQTICDILYNILCNILKNQPNLKNLITEVHKLFKLYLIILVTTASAGRNFPALKQLKTYLRNSMAQQRLNHCMLLHIHSNKTDGLNLKDNITKFIQLMNEENVILDNTN